MKHITALAPRFILRFLELQRLIRKHKIELNGAKVMEIGPGLGDVASWILADFTIESFDLVEASPRACDILLSRFGDFSEVTVFKDLESLAKNSYDVQFCFEVLEHIENDLELMATMHSLGRVGSYVFGSVPAYMSKWQNVDEWAGHIRRYEKAELQEKLETVGFEIIELYTYGFPYTNLMYPLRQLHYRDPSGIDESKQAATYNSGIDRKPASKFSTYFIFLLLKYSYFIQRVPILSDFGDGFIFLAKKR